LRLYWSGSSPLFDLEDQDMRRWLYQIVPREASRPKDLTGYLDRDTLIGVWPEPHLPKACDRPGKAPGDRDRLADLARLPSAPSGLTGGRGW
jgi:hypothetical protein